MKSRRRPRFECVGGTAANDPPAGPMLREERNLMVRVICAFVVATSLIGCAQCRPRTACVSCDGGVCDTSVCNGGVCDGGLCQGGACDDCLPPQVAGRYFYAQRLDNLLTSCTAQKCARRDLKQFPDDCGRLSRDFRDGYTQAYIDLAAGRPACVPAVPPPKYWHAWHRSCAGRDAVDQWYAGYRNGLDNGVNGGVNHFNRIIPSPEGCCVSAAYVNPYATQTPPNTIQPLNRQTISRRTDDGAQTLPAQAENASSPQAPVENPAALELTSGPEILPAAQ